MAGAKEVEAFGHQCPHELSAFGAQHALCVEASDAQRCECRVEIGEVDGGNQDNEQRDGRVNIALVVIEFYCFIMQF